MPTSELFPALKWCSRVMDSAASDERLFDVKWYPYATTDNDQIFAVCGLQNVVFVCRPKENADPPFEILRWWQHDEPDTAFNSIVWTKDPVSGNPIICVAGSRPRYITILDVFSGERTRTLQGHGKAVNDLAISPQSKSILASAAEDHTIRLWNLEAQYEEQPCVAIFAGGGHRQAILSLNFHPNGKWLLSGAQDNAVAMWAVPSLEELSNRPQNAEPLNVLYPAFFSTEVHAGYVDNVHFYGNLIISRASKDQSHHTIDNEILIWQIDNFDAEENPPFTPVLPEPGKATRSAFPHAPQSRGFRRVVTLDMPHTDRFYLRFGLLHAPNMRPILVMGNQRSRFSFWDLQLLEEGWSPAIEDRVGRPKRTVAQKSVGRGKSREKSSTPLSTTSSSARADGVEQGSEVGSGAIRPSAEPSSGVTAERMYELNDPFKRIEPHGKMIAKTTLSSKEHFQVEQMAWSPDGTWLIAACDKAILCVFHRDANFVNGT
ncbi:WD40 repeat-like protein [Polychaeton citri CBS 116435]|uniref:WD40 repeat-like protein n=1 Tax=Polychaeton citri CBS 116435 TaxID=1314669 RepID=A0A9P4UK26_9PEZI|nr:WD40 repeat-like protein [Polychaeton citri CBS 116435]